MQQYILLSYFLKNIIIRLNLRHRLRHIRLVFELFKALQSIHFHEESKIERSGDIVDVTLIYHQFFFDDVKQTFLNPFFDLKPYRLPPLSLLELLLDLLQEIFRLLLLE